MILGLLLVYCRFEYRSGFLIAANLGRFYTTPKKLLSCHLLQVYNIVEIAEKLQVLAIKTSFFKQ